jgi:hypothetical protein
MGRSLLAYRPFRALEDGVYQVICDDPPELFYARRRCLCVLMLLLTATMGMIGDKALLFPT